MWLAESGISEGWKMNNGTRQFRPYANVARADMAAFLYRLADSQDIVVGAWGYWDYFSDVSLSTSHSSEILWLAQYGISKGWEMPDGTLQFRPYTSVARADMAFFLYRLNGYYEVMTDGEFVID